VTLRLRVAVVFALATLSGAAVMAQTIDAAPAVVTVRLLRAAGVMALVPAALLFVLSRYRPRDYVRAWTAVWLCLAATLFVYSSDEGVLLPAVAALIWLGGSALLALSAGWIRGAVSWPRSTWPVTLMVSGGVLAGTLVFGAPALRPAFWLAALCLLAGAYRFLQLARHESFFGALLIGCALTAVPLHAGISQAIAPFSIVMLDRVEVWIMVYAVLALGMHLVVFEDVTYELRRQNAALKAVQTELTAKAVTDPLTGCYNRRFFSEVGARELKRHQRHQMPLSLLFVDCDRFKTINDEHGHEAGDRVLRLIADILRDHVRQSDYVFRWGGDEFLVMLTCDEESARKKAREIRHSFANRLGTVVHPTGGAPVTLSVGCVSVPADAGNLESYVRAVDEQMYAEKTARHSPIADR
jgi:diguanylate cyclase (GGDEF)-like protein